MLIMPNTIENESEHRVHKQNGHRGENLKRKNETKMEISLD